MSRLLLVFLVLGVFSQTPQSPLWPNTFWQNFKEKTIDPNLGNHENTGSYYYNYNLPSYRVDKSSGQFDYFCGVGGPYANVSTACNQYVVSGNRYLHFPEKNYCCYCCNSTSGCGVLLPNWMNGAQYIDTEVHEGQQCYKWLKMGNQKNYFYETVASVPVNRVTVSIYEEPSNFMDFGPRNSTLPSGILNLPSICNLNTPCNWGACQEIRG